MFKTTFAVMVHSGDDDAVCDQLATPHERRESRVIRENVTLRE